MEQPYLSLVLASRNDDHGGHLIERTRLAMESFIYQVNACRMPSEIVMVDWNPLAHRPHLSEELQVDPGEFCRVRFITVPQDIHNTFQYSDLLTFYQYLAKNVGIRRAEGKFILVSNVDILFSDQIISEVYNGLESNMLYRADRYDLELFRAMQPKLAISPLDNLLMRSRIIRKNMFHKTKILHGSDSNVNIHMRLYPSRSLCRFLMNRFDIHVWTFSYISEAHTNACGDFTMLSKENWMSLKGYYEFEGWSFHIDSLLLSYALAHKIKQHIFKHPVYHIEHEGGWTPASDINEKIDMAGIPQITFQTYDLIAERLSKHGSLFKFNNKNWGLANHTLDEVVIEPNSGAHITGKFSLDEIRQIIDK